MNPRSRPRATDETVRRRMENQRRRDTAAELALRRELFGRGLRYRVDLRLVGRRRADIAFTRARVAVFVDGCFWHRCPAHGTVPKSNREWWIAKLHANEARDRATDQALAEMGWAVVRVWEHSPAQAAADRIERLVRSRRSRRGEGVDVGGDVVEEAVLEAK